MDNNVFASACFDAIIDEIKECGFGKGAKYHPANDYEIAIKNIEEGYNLRAYLKKIVSLYDKIADKISDKKSDEEVGEFYLKREQLGLLFRKQQPKRLLLNLMRLLVTIIMNFLNLVVEYVILTLIKALMLD